MLKTGLTSHNRNSSFNLSKEGVHIMHNNCLLCADYTEGFR